MTPNRTRPTDADVDAFVAAVKSPRRRADAHRVLALMREVSGDAGRMWGPSIVGFGVHRYPLAGDRVGEICRIGFAPRARAIALYLGDFPERDDCLARLGTHDTGAGCIYVPRVDGVDADVLREMLAASWRRPDGV